MSNEAPNSAGEPEIEGAETEASAPYGDASAELAGDTGTLIEQATSPEAAGKAKARGARRPSVLDTLRANPLGGTPRAARPRAQPASGTAEDAAAVNFVDSRERTIGIVLAVLEPLLGLVGYMHDRHYVEHPGHGISAAKAHSDTLLYQHGAPWLLGIALILGAFIGLAVISRRRAAVGFTILLSGLFLMQVSPLLGLVYLGLGGWMIFRMMRRRPSAASQAAGRTAGGASAGAGGARPGAARTSAGRAAAAAAAKSAPTPSSRYTPPRPRRPAPPVQETKPEPEKESRLTSWLRR
jgi:hypothetical protein